MGSIAKLVAFASLRRLGGDSDGKAHINGAALSWLNILRTDVERANAVTAHHLTTNAIFEALYWVKSTEGLRGAAADARILVNAFRRVMLRDVTGRSIAAESARRQAMQAIDMLAARVRSAPASVEFKHLM